MSESLRKYSEEEYQEALALTMEHLGEDKYTEAYALIKKYPDLVNDISVGDLGVLYLSLLANDARSARELRVSLIEEIIKWDGLTRVTEATQEPKSEYKH